MDIIDYNGRTLSHSSSLVEREVSGDGKSQAWSLWSVGARKEGAGRSVDMGPRGVSLVKAAETEMQKAEAACGGCHVPCPTSTEPLAINTSTPIRLTQLQT